MHSVRKEPVFWLVILAASAAAGLMYDWLVETGQPIVAVIHGIFMAAPLLAFESGALAEGWQQRLRRLPTFLAVPGAELTYVVLISLGHALAGLILWSIGVEKEPLVEAIVPSGRVLIYALAVSAVVVSVIRIRDLIGSEVFLSLLVGRYHRPKREERVFLFVDLVGSTRFAESFGDLRAQEFLSAFFATLAEPVRAHRGAVDDYVGDMALITWPLARGLKDARCVACVFAIEEALAREAATFRERFGAVPRFRAALHAGSVVTAEVGVDRHKIAYFGDTVNATARLESLCGTLGIPVLISADLLDRIATLPDGVVARRLGDHSVRGRDRPLAVAALEKGGLATVDEPGRREAIAAG
jgi:adenylate cyclase